MSATIDITINGKPTSLAASATLVDALASLGITADQSGVAVALGDAVVRRADWATTALGSGDRVEVVTAAQGG